MNRKVVFGEVYEFLDGTQWRVKHVDLWKNQIVFRRFAPTLEEIEKKTAFNFIKVACESMPDASTFFGANVVVGW